MNKPGKQTSRFATVLISATFCLLAVHSAQGKEPYYNGKPLSDWLCCEPLDEAQNAVRQMGTNAIPTLLDMLGITEKTAKKVAARLGSKTIQRDARSEDFRIDDVQEVAVERGFGVLGTNAESAIPQLLKLLEGEETTSRATEALAVVGPKGFAALTNTLATSPMRGSIIAALGEKGGGDPKVVTQLLINALKDENPGIRANAADFLAGRDPDLAISALIQALDDKEPDPRRWAAISLGHYGAAAINAAPKILSLYTNAPDVLIFETLKKIDRETAGKAEEFLVNSSPLGARNGYTRTLLKNGKELVVGGRISTAIATITNRELSRAEIYDPATGAWTETGALNTARDEHTATLLRNGNVLVAGGSDSKGNALSSAEIYDPITEKWAITGSLNKPHSGAHAVLQSDGKVLIFYGGWTPSVRAFDEELYDPITGTWSVVTNK